MPDVTVPPVGVWIFPEAPAPALVKIARRAELDGIDELWVGDEGTAREPFAVLAAAAASTRTIRLAVGVTNPYVRHPGIAMASMLTIHELSGGRAILGVGAGGQMSLAPFGIEPERPLARVGDFIRIARAVADREAIDGYDPPAVALDAAQVGPPLPVYVGARGERLNRLASAEADGAFVAGLPPFRYPEVIGWARSSRPIDIALYPSVAFTTEAIERHRPEMIWGLVDSPDAVRHELGLDRVEIERAASSLRAGDDGQARRLVDDDVLGRLMLLGDPRTVGHSLAELVRTHRPTSIGLAILQNDLVEGIEDASRAFQAMRRALGTG